MSSMFNRSRFLSAGAGASLGREPLSNAQIARFAPSAFAVEKHSSRSERYAYIPTSEVIDGLRANGFLPMFAKQGSSRVEGKADFTKHLIRFRHAGAEGRAGKKVGDTFPEVVLVNSHDGTSAYKIMAGLFRLVCLNGMVVADRAYANVTIPHKGNVTDLVIEGSYTVLSESRRALDVADAWQGVALSRPEQIAMADSARTIRFGDDEGNTDTPIRAEQLLQVRRHADAGNSLWEVTNRIQESVIRGGLTAMGQDANGRARRTTTREVKGIDADVKMNKALWALAERMAEIKAA